MSGGVAYVFDPEEKLLGNCNLELVELEKLEAAEDVDELKTLVQNHQQYTGSETARKILSDWDASLAQFVKVMPVDYKRALKEMAEEAAASA